MALFGSPWLSAVSSITLISGVWSVLLKSVVRRCQKYHQTRIESVTERSRHNSAVLARFTGEIRAQLAGIRTMNSLALSGGLPEQANDCLEAAQESLHSLTALVDDLCDLTQAGAARAELCNRPFPIRATIDDAIRAVCSPAFEKNPALSVTVNPEIPLHLSGDANCVRQILVHLMRAAMRLGGEGKIEIHAQPLEGLASGIGIEFLVRARGVIIRKKHYGDLLESLRPIPGRSPLPAGRSALSLVLCSQLARQMSADISVRNEPGAAICFRFTGRFVPASGGLLPAPDAEAHTRSLLNLALAGQDQTGESESGGGPLEVLVAENNAVSRRLLVRMLEHRGCLVHAAGNGAQALALIAQETVDLIFMDLRMPTLDGLDVARTVRHEEQGTGRHVPIIALTPYVLNGDERGCLDAGMDDYLTKPVRHRDLTRILARYARSPIPDAPTPRDESSVI